MLQVNESGQFTTEEGQVAVTSEDGVTQVITIEGAQEFQTEGIADMTHYDKSGVAHATLLTAIPTSRAIEFYNSNGELVSTYPAASVTTSNSNFISSDQIEGYQNATVMFQSPDGLHILQSSEQE